MIKALKHRGKTHPNAATACIVCSQNDKCNELQAELLPNEINSFPKDAWRDYRLRVEDSMRQSAAEVTLGTFSLIFSPLSVSGDGMTVADGNIGLRLL